MANPYTGCVEVKAGDETVKLSFSANALCELEDKLDMGVSQFGSLMSDPEKIRMKTVRTIFYVAMLDHQPEVTEETVKSVLSSISPPDAIGAIMRAFALAFPDPESGGGANPPKPSQDGTGKDS